MALLDTQADYDGDGLPNITDSNWAAGPDIIDTDDDGLVGTAVSRSHGTNPTNPGPTVRVALHALARRRGLSDRSDVSVTATGGLGLWKAGSTPIIAAGGYVVRRAVQGLRLRRPSLNYVLGLEPAGSQVRRLPAYVRMDGVTNFYRGAPIATGAWVHLASTYKLRQRRSELHIPNGVFNGGTNAFFQMPPGERPWLATRSFASAKVSAGASTRSAGVERGPFRRQYPGEPPHDRGRLRRPGPQFPFRRLARPTPTNSRSAHFHQPAWEPRILTYHE